MKALIAVTAALALSACANIYKEYPNKSAELRTKCLAVAEEVWQHERKRHASYTSAGYAVRYSGDAFEKCMES